MVRIFSIIYLMCQTGVYFAKDGTVSMGTYATTTSLRWSKSEIAPLSCLALAEIINSPQDFTSKDPYYVVAQVDWILWYVQSQYSINEC